MGIKKIEMVVCDKCGKEIKGRLIIHVCPCCGKDICIECQEKEDAKHQPKEKKPVKVKDTDDKMLITDLATTELASTATGILDSNK